MMSRAPRSAAVEYFGKIPGRADFVKGSDNPALIKLLDDWLANAMDLLSEDVRWKLIYDAMPPLSFVLLGPRRTQAIAGHIVASADQSSRRFPFLMMSNLEVAEPASFVASAPLVLSVLWNRLERLTKDVLEAAAPSLALVAAASHVVDLDLHSPAHNTRFADFLATHSIGALQAQLAQDGFDGSVRQVMLALGILLQPVMASTSSRLEKCLRLPLPADPMYRNLVAAFWLHLITPFLARADFELAMFMTRIGRRDALVLGFSGASATTLQAVMDPHALPEQQIDFDWLDWVEQHVNDGYAIKKLSAYLSQSDLSLQSALDSSCAAFIGS